MSGFAKLQFIGPAILLLALAGAEGAAIALNCAPTSQTLWYINSMAFGIFRRSEDALSAHFDIAHLQFCFIGLPLFLVASCGLLWKRPLLLALGSNLTFLYISVLIYDWYAHAPMRTASLVSTGGFAGPDVVMCLLLIACALLSFAVSHILYIRDLRNAFGRRVN